MYFKIKSTILILVLMIFFQTTLFAQIEATKSTLHANNKIRKSLPFTTYGDFIKAKRGFIATIDENQFTSGQDPIYNPNFLPDESPSTVNPTLWRESELASISGLFEVLPGQIYQVRGFDLTNMSFVKTANGWIIIDPLTAKSSARYGYELFQEHVSKDPIKAIIFTHSGFDNGFKSEIFDTITASNIFVVAPKNFVEDVVDENLLTSCVTVRRGMYKSGILLPSAADGYVGTAIRDSNRLVFKSFLQPTVEIDTMGTQLVIDDLKIEFMRLSKSGAPKDMMLYFPAYKSLFTGKIINHNLQSLYNLSGSKIKNGLLWSKYIDDAIVKYGDHAEISFGSYLWPTWGNATIMNYWEGQRDIYRFIHDQTLLFANKGYIPSEIAEKVKLPESLAKKFTNYNYYERINQYVKGQYALYLGWFDGNPSNLNPLAPVELGTKYINAMGGEDNVLAIARKDFEKGEYRWVATLLNHLVFANPSNISARELLAETLAQMGYQSENREWRNFYLTGAYELKHGRPSTGFNTDITSETMNTLPLQSLFDFLAMRIDVEKAENKRLVINLKFTDLDEKATLILNNGVLTNRVGIKHKSPMSTVTISKIDFLNLFFQKDNFENLSSQSKIVVDGEEGLLKELISVIDIPNPLFNIIEP